MNFYNKQFQRNVNLSFRPIQVFFYKHMKLRIQARLCLATYDFEARIMLSLCLTFQGTGLSKWEKFNSNLASN